MKNVSDLALWCVVLGAASFACNGSRSNASTDPHAAAQDLTRCADCHTPEYSQTTHPPHPDARPTSCGVCHTQTSWHPWRVDHPGYALTGAHLKAAQDEALAGKEKQVKCFWCHRGDPSTFKNTKTDCLSCHASDRVTSTFPGHETFAASCQDCHSTDAWKPAKKPEIAAAVETETVVDAGAATHAVAPHASAKPKPRATATAITTATATATAITTATATATATSTAPAPDVTSQASRRH